MKPLLVLMMTVAILLPAAVSYADKPANGAAKTVAAVTAKDAPDVVYPYTFVCQHCGMKMTINSKADWAKDCNACACGMKSSDCQPKKK